MSLDQLNALATSRYGVGLLALGATAALWLAEEATKATGTNQWAQVDLLRSRYGLGTAFPAYGSTCFPRVARAR